MQTLKLAIEFFDNLLSGEKQCTVRKGHRDIVNGPLVFVATENERLSYRVDVTGVTHKTVKELTDYDAIEDGYLNVDELIEDLARFYPDLTRDSEITVISFDAQ